MSQQSQAEGVDGTFLDDEPDEWQAPLDDSLQRREGKAYSAVSGTKESSALVVQVFLRKTSN